MDAKSYSRVAAIIFAIIAVLQLVRALSGWDITLNGAAIPFWASWLASVVAGALAWSGSPLLETVLVTRRGTWAHPVEADLARAENWP